MNIPIALLSVGVGVGILSWAPAEASAQSAEAASASSIAGSVGPAGYPEWPDSRVAGGSGVEREEPGLRQDSGADTVRLSLEDVIRWALVSNPTLRAQRASARAKGQLPLQATPAFLPSLSLGVQGLRTTDPVAVFGLKLRQENFAAEDLALDALNRPDAYAGYNTTATVQLPLLAPEGLFGFAAARKAADAAEAGARRAAGATRFFAVQAYWGAQLAARQVEAIDTALASVRAHVRQAEAMHQQGLVTGLDARLANVKAAEIEAQRLGAAAQAENALSSLRAMLDLPDSVALVLTDYLSGEPLLATCAEPGPPDCSIDQRSDLQAYRLGAEAASHGVKRAVAAQLPAIAAFGSVGHYARNAPLGDGSGDWTIGIGLTWNPFQGLSGLGGVKAARAEREAAEAQRDAAILQAELEVRQATRLLAAAEESALVAASAAREAQVALEQARLRYRTGTSPITELLDVQAAATNATLTELSARRDLFMAHAALDLAYGVHDR